MSHSKVTCRQAIKSPPISGSLQAKDSYYFIVRPSVILIYDTAKCLG